MFNLVNIVSDILTEQDNPTGVPAVPPVANNDSNVNKVKDQIQKDLSTIETNAKKNASLTNLANTGTDLVNYYMIELGKHYLGRYDSRIAQKRQDEITAKYVDVGYQIFSTIRTFDKSIETKVTDLKTLNEALNSLLPQRQQELTQVINIINTFAGTPIESYQCKDPLLKGITSADNLSNVALQTLYSQTIYGAVNEILKRRAGALKAKINQNELKKLLLYPGAYGGSIEAVPEPLEQTLADNSMHSQRIQAIGAAAIEYYKHLVNQQNLIIKQQHQNEETPQEEHKNFFDHLSREFLNEADNQVGYTKAYGDNYDAVFGDKNKTNPQKQTQSSTTDNKQPQKQEGQRQQYAKVDLFNPKSWKRDSNFERIYLREYDSFITNGTSKYVPGEQVTTAIDKIDAALDRADIPKPLGQEIAPEYKKPMKYTLEAISKDPSNQARTLIEAFRLIAEFTKTKKTFMQRLGQTAQALGALRTGMGPVN